MNQDPRHGQEAHTEDDGRVIANMNVEGMPWYQPRRPGHDRPDAPAQRHAQQPPTWRETFQIMRAAFGAAMLIAAVVSAVGILFVLLLLWLWH